MDYHTLLVNQEAISVRQLSKWGIQISHGSFLHLKTSLNNEEVGDQIVYGSVQFSNGTGRDKPNDEFIYTYNTAFWTRYDNLRCKRYDQLVIVIK